MGLAIWLRIKLVSARVLGVAGLCAMALQACHSENRLKDQRAFIFHPDLVWTSAKHRCEPVFPAGLSSQNLRGLVVVHLRFGIDGRVINSTAVESPSALLTANAVECAKQWVMPPVVSDSDPSNREGKLYFYFIARDSVRHVFIANDAAQRAAVRAAWKQHVQ